MGQNPSETGLIAGEPALMKHIGYALDLMDMVIRNSHHEVDIQDLIKIQHHLINAKYAVPRFTTEADDDAQAVAYNTEPVGSPWEKAQAALDNYNDGSCEGEMQAEAEAERQADAALELSAELALCDWEGWE